MLNNFVIRRIANFMQWPVVKAHMKRFKMADDLQRSAFYFQLNQAQKLSDQTLLQEVDQDPGVEDERKQLEMSRQVDTMRKQQLAQAGIQGEVMLVQGRYQAKAQEAMMASQAKLQEQQGGQMGGAGMLGPDQMAGNDAAGGSGGIPQNMLGDGGPGDAQPGATGQQGEMIPGQQADPAMPEGSTVSTENAQNAPTDGIPLTAASPLQMGQKGGGYNLLYLAKRAANALKKMDPMQANMELNKMRMSNPQLGALVLQILQKERGSQKDPLNPMQSPQPQQKPTRRASSTGV
jgi:hypothetical protein